MKYYLYNPKAHSCEKFNFKSGQKIVNVLELDYEEFVKNLDPSDEIVLVGGDGTINYFVNHVDVDSLPNNIYVMAGGTGNDFFIDIEGDLGSEVLATEKLKKLPTLTANGITMKFINGAGFGLDGYCTEEADRIRYENPSKKINYTNLAIKGVLFGYKPRKATVIVDEKMYTFTDVYISPTMKGRYYGGGMVISPKQNRMSDELSLVVIHCDSKLKVLSKILPSIFKGGHVKYEENVSIITGKDFEVTFDEPCALQVDGETIYNVKSYKVHI